MRPQSDSLFSTPRVLSLLEYELRLLGPELAGVFGRQALFVRANIAAPRTFSAPMLGRVAHLHVATPDELDGDLRCRPDALPFEDASFRLLLVQHAAEAVSAGDAFRAELARILEPGGLAIVCGFRPLGLWRPWLMIQARRYRSLQLASAASWRRALAGDGVDAFSLRRIGPLGRADVAGNAAPAASAWRDPLSPLRPSWLLLARKRTLGPNLMPRRVVSREPAGRPRLASGTQRASA